MSLIPIYFCILMPSLFVGIHQQPNLYTLVVVLKDASGLVVDCESCLVGIRQVSKAPKQLLVNGHPVVIRGVNRHEHHPRIGKTNIESCMVKVLFVPLLHLAISLAISSCSFGDFIHYTCGFLILLLTGFGSDEATQYQRCQKQSLSTASPLV